MSRVSTESIIEHPLKLFPNNNLNTLDLGVGGGSIGLSLAYERHSWRFIGADLSIDALTIANYNTNRINLKELAAVNLMYSSWFSSIYMHRYVLVISNPPYISIKDLHINIIRDSQPEPTISLASSNSGLQDIANICLYSIFFLTYGGWLLLEHGYSQGSIVRSFILGLSFKGVHSIKDYNNERITIGNLL